MSEKAKVKRQNSKPVPGNVSIEDDIGLGKYAFHPEDNGKAKVRRLCSSTSTVRLNGIRYQVPVKANACGRIVEVELGVHNRLVCRVVDGDTNQAAGECFDLELFSKAAQTSSPASASATAPPSKGDFTEPAI